MAKDESIESLRIGFGLDSTNFEQVRKVVEVRRFPYNDGTVANRGRDVLLLGVNAPFELDGTTTGYMRPLWPFSHTVVQGTQRLAGWDLLADPDSPTTRLHEKPLQAFAADPDVYNDNNGRPAGNRVWWMNTSPDPLEGVLPMSADIGTGSFVEYNFASFLTSIQGGVPPLRRNGSQNFFREAIATSVTDLEILKWVELTTFGRGPETIELAGDVGACSTGRGRLELFGVKTNGTMGWWTRTQSWSEHPSLSAPTEVALARTAPGVYCGAGKVYLFAQGLDGGIWTRTAQVDALSPGVWTRLADATTPINSGISVVGVLPEHLYVFARGTTGELRYAEFDGEWTGRWENLGGSLAGAPAARMAAEGRIDVFWHATDGGLNQSMMLDGEWQRTAEGDFFGQLFWPIESDVALVSWVNDRIDLFFRYQGNLAHWPFVSGWAPIMDTGIAMPYGSPVAVGGVPGEFDIFMTPPAGNVWNARWPRSPQPD